jgi:tetratricopeptide (TPR) repeat protein
LQQHPCWLLILDNLEDRADAAELLARVGPHGHVIITTRRNFVWKGAARPLSLEVLTPEASVELVARLTGQRSPEPVPDLAKELGYLPLALEQAGAYIAQQQITIADYLGLLRKRPAHILGRVDEGGDESRAIAQIWQVTLDAIERRNPLAVMLLRIMAYYAPDNIPRDLLAGAADDPELVNEALGLLSSYCMISLLGDVVSVHRLVQAVLRVAKMTTRAKEGEKPPDPIMVATRLLYVSAPNGNIRRAVEQWPRWRTLVPHIDSLASLTPDDAASDELAELLVWSSTFVWVQGQHHIALQMAQRALTIGEKALDPEHPNLAIQLDNLAQVLHDLGKLDEALPLHRRALAISEKALGPEHPDVAITLNNLAQTLHNLGRLDEALPLQRRALAISEKALGTEHPAVAIRLSNIARTLHNLGRLDEALPLQRRALAISEKALGTEHPDVATVLDNLATRLNGLGRFDEALPLRQRALAISEKALGLEHPNIAIRLSNLAATLVGLGRLDEALPLLQRALTVSEEALG